jgi:hypothetical protein
MQRRVSCKQPLHTSQSILNPRRNLMPMRRGGSPPVEGERESGSYSGTQQWYQNVGPSQREDHWGNPKLYPIWQPGNKNSPTITHTGCKTRPKWGPSAQGYNWATLTSEVINTEAWSSRLGVGCEADNLTP